MLRNILKTAWRNLSRHRFHSIVNMVGLSAGIAFVAIIAAYVWSELQVNNNLRNAENQYIIQSRWTVPGTGPELISVAPLAKSLYEEYPTLVANYYRFDGVSTNVSHGDKHFRESFQIGDSTLFSMYGFSLLHGDSRTALADPFSVVIAESAAIKFFGKTDVIGQTISIENFAGQRHDFAVTGIIRNHARNSVSSLLDEAENQFYVPSEACHFFGREMTSWDNPHLVSYIVLQKGVTPDRLEKPIQQLLKKNASAYTVSNLTEYLIPLKTYYLERNNGLVKKMIYVLSSIALFILLMAAVNFVNLSISHSTTRLKEVGIRKAMGGMRTDLLLQFLTESVVMVAGSTIAALVFYSMVRNYAGIILERSLPSLTDFPFYFAFLPIAFSIILGMLAGIYPALALSSSKAVDSLKGKLTTIREKIWLRKSLVIFQFSVAIIVFAAAMIISQQISYFFSNSLGYDKDLIVSAQVPRDWSIAGVQQMESIRAQLEALPQVSKASLSFEIPDGRNSGGAGISPAGNQDAITVPTQFLNTDGYYASTFGIPMKAGVFFSHNPATIDSNAVVINETEAKALGWKDAQDAIGKQVKLSGVDQPFTVAGVTADFHFGSMQEAVQPITFMHVNNTAIYRYLSLRLKPGNISSSIEAIKKEWSKLMPFAPFEFKFMDETLQNVYRTELQLQRAAYAACILALSIVLLGVLGLVASSIQRRTREIGIRKVLGSSVTQIVLLFVNEFLVLIAVACSIAIPAAYLLMQDWLHGYVYRISISAKPFVFAVMTLGSLTALLIVLLTAKTALLNPVKSLRTE